MIFVRVHKMVCVGCKHINEYFIIVDSGRSQRMMNELARAYTHPSWKSVTQIFNVFSSLPLSVSFSSMEFV